jgi:molybdopterin biosynthesis enzyme MoaB
MTTGGTGFAPSDVTLIVNFPGSPGSVTQAGEAIAGALPHALDLIAGRLTSHDPLG